VDKIERGSDPTFAPTPESSSVPHPSTCGRAYSDGDWISEGSSYRLSAGPQSGDADTVNRVGIFGDEQFVAHRRRRKIRATVN